jgi:hypothetical protein
MSRPSYSGPCSVTTTAMYSCSEVAGFPGVLTGTNSVDSSSTSTATSTYSGCNVTTTYQGSCSQNISYFNYTSVDTVLTALPPDTCDLTATQASDGSWSGSVTSYDYYTGTNSEAVTSCSVCNTSGCNEGTTSGGTTTTYSDEYTDAEFEADVVASLPAWGTLPAFGTGVPVELASAELATDGSSYSILESRYQGAHPIPPAGYYKVTWVQRFTPDGGGAVVDSPESYIWNGVTPGDYNPTDPTTWPTTPVFEVDAPATNGEVTFVNLVVSCVDSGEDDGDDGGGL